MWPLQVAAHKFCGRKPNLKTTELISPKSPSSMTRKVPYNLRESCSAFEDKAYRYQIPLSKASCWTRYHRDVFCERRLSASWSLHKSSWWEKIHLFSWKDWYAKSWVIYRSSMMSHRTSVWLCRISAVYINLLFSLIDLQVFFFIFLPASLVYKGIYVGGAFTPVPQKRLHDSIHLGGAKLVRYIFLSLRQNHFFIVKTLNKSKPCR